MKTGIIVALVLTSTAAIAQTSTVPALAYADFPLDKEALNRIHTAATEAYADAASNGLTNMDSTSIKGCFFLFNDEDGLGKQGDRIAHAIIYALGKARGFVLVNVETMRAQVVFPKEKEKNTEPPGGAYGSPEAGSPTAHP